MNPFTRRIGPAIDHELNCARRAEARGDLDRSFAHLERAHVLGQASTRHHVRVHLRMLAWAWRRRQAREAAGQLLRIVGAATKTPFGWVPTGNTGGSNVSPFRPLPIPDELQGILREARSADAPGPAAEG